MRYSDFMEKESFWDRAKYVLRVSRKPTDEELIKNLKIILAGILLLGGIGLVISIAFWFIYP
jgi:protein translocase SEC61 complex gamma subunit